LKSEDLRDILRQVSVPVQFVLGDADPICPLAVKGPLEKLLASLRVDVIKGCGHFPFLSRPEKFNALLEGSIKECR
jgi:pimeloyl-[acyl-carrier protein] methyl ester esterase